MGFLLCAIVVTMFCPSCGEKAYVDDLDTLRGMWGKVLLYNEKGDAESDNSEVKIKVRCVDTVSSSPLAVFDTTFFIVSSADGAWEISEPVGGWYSLHFSKAGYCDNVVYSHYYDTSEADTLAPVYLAMQAQGSVEIDSLRLVDGVLSIYRTLYFTANYSSYSLATWYFFGKSASVSPEDYEYAYVSGSSTSSGSSKQSMAVYKPIDKLLEAGFVEGETVYVRAYCDNARAVSYQVGEDSWVYPNVTGESTVQSFEIPETEEE